MVRDRRLFLLSAEQFYGGKSTNAGRGQAVTRYSGHLITRREGCLA